MKRRASGCSVSDSGNAQLARRRQRPQHAARRVLHDARAARLVDDAELLRPARVDGLAGQQQVERRGRAGELAAGASCRPSRARCRASPRAGRGACRARRPRRDSGTRARARVRRRGRSRGSARASGTTRARDARTCPSRACTSAIAPASVAISPNSSMSAPAMKPFALPDRMISPFGGSRSSSSSASLSSASTVGRQRVRARAGLVERERGEAVRARA